MRSLFGSSAAMCVEAAQHGDDRYLPAERTVRIEAPGPKDGIPAGMCSECGFPGPHSGARECIDALRDRIAVLEFKARKLGK